MHYNKMMCATTSWVVERRRIRMLLSSLLSFIIVALSLFARATDRAQVAHATSCPVKSPTTDFSRKKVFVYALPPHLGSDVLLAGDPACSRLAGGQRWQWMYSTEFAVYQALLGLPMSRQNDSQSLFASEQRPLMFGQLLRTLDPTEADLFFIPGFAACHLHSNTSATPTMDFVATSEYLAECVGHVRTEHPFFNMSGGADHFMVLSHDIGRCLLGHRRSQFGETFFITHTGDSSTNHGSHYAAYVDTYSASVSPTLSEKSRFLHQEFRNAVMSGPCFRPGIDVVIPPATGVFLLPQPDVPNISAAMQPMYRLVVDGGAFSFPAPPNEGFSRRKLAVFRGSVYDISSPHSFGSRQVLLERFRAQVASGNWSQVSVFPTSPYQIDHSTYRRTYFLELLNAKFCLCLPGFAPWTVRLFEAVLFGCIPVILSDPTNFLPFSDSLMNLIDWEHDVALTITFHDLVYEDMQDLLLKIPPAEVTRRQHNMLRIRHLLTYPYGTNTHKPHSAVNVATNVNHGALEGTRTSHQESSLGMPQNAIDAIFALLLEKARNLSRHPVDSPMAA